MDLTRTFQHSHNDQIINFHVTYDLQTHSFNIVEDDNINYILTYNPALKQWSATEDPAPSIPVPVLAELVQQSYGMFV